MAGAVSVEGTSAWSRILRDTVCDDLLDDGAAVKSVCATVGNEHNECKHPA